MNITIIAVGRIGKCSEEELISRYKKRLSWRLEVIEVEDKRPITGPERQASEADKLLAAVPDRAFVVALDEKGKQFTSPEFASAIENWQLRGFSHIAFLIGGADGHGPAVLKRADLKLSLGPMTWPHMMARAFLVEQIYRASSILSGHPYHKL